MYNITVSLVLFYLLVYLLSSQYAIGDRYRSEAYASSYANPTVNLACCSICS